MRKLLAAVLAAILVVAAVPLRAEPAMQAALAPAAEEPADATYFGLSRRTAMTVAAVGAAALVGGAALAYTAAGANLAVAAGALYVGHLVVEAALVAGAGGLGYLSLGDPLAPN